MRAFRIGYILTLSFLLILMMITMTFGFFPAPNGPKAPTYPSSTDSYSSSTYNSTEYRKSMQQYEDAQAKYQKEQKTFVQDKVVPYVRNVFVSWVVLILLFQIIGLVLAKFASAFVGAAYSFSGLWAILFGPLSGIIWAAASLVSSFSRGAEGEFTVRPIFQAIGSTCLVGVLVLTVMGIFFYGRIKAAMIPTEATPDPDPPPVSPLIPPPADPPPAPPMAPPPNLAP